MAVMKLVTAMIFLGINTVIHAVAMVNLPKTYVKRLTYLKLAEIDQS